MEGLATSAFLSLSVLYLMISYVRSELSVEDCLALGYNRATLVCSSCDLLEKFELTSLKTDCLQCCKAEDPGPVENPVKKYPKARLEVQAFVKSDRPGKFPNLQVKYMGGQMPQIRLIDADGNEETLSITKWDTDTIVEFLQTHLESPPEPERDDENRSDNEI
ncbi:15 kDa selenoprotein [Orchesella cincta]|uniref:Selenoprotein F n=1 Tax=Orchesella cincta TaxID=48709 RepID=A0A1D2M9J2_ORCCI|nr:15 kDa selenoprotein [Orchesella cincta]